MFSRKEAISYFNEKGLVYKDISEGDVLTLVYILNLNVKKASKEGLMSTNTMRLSEKIKSKFTPNGIMKECFIYLNSHYFTRRECISFWPNGSISFAGWADDKNLSPVTSAFMQWVDMLVKDKEVEGDGMARK